MKKKLFTFIVRQIHSSLHSESKIFVTNKIIILNYKDKIYNFNKFTIYVSKQYLRVQEKKHLFKTYTFIASLNLKFIYTFK